MDCRHGRVLIQAKDYLGHVYELTVWDPTTGDQHHLVVPAYPRLEYNYTGAVLCAKDVCDHLDCHGGPFLVALVGTSSYNHGERHTWARVYSSETDAWSAVTTNDNTNQLHIAAMRPSIVFGDALYLSTACRVYKIVKYDLHKHELSVMDMPGDGCRILIRGDDGGLGVAAILNNFIYLWSWKVGINGFGEWVKYMVVNLDDTLLPRGVQPRELICLADGTNTVFIGIQNTGIFMIHLKSREVRKIGEGHTYNKHILPYTCFYTPKYSLAFP